MQHHEHIANHAPQVVRALLDFIPAPRLPRRRRRPDFSTWGISKESADFLAQAPNAFLLGAIFDRMIPAPKAWEAPRLLAERLGHLDVHRIAGMSMRSLGKVVGRHSGQPALHRFPNETADSIVSACRRLVSKYDGDASNVWSPDPGAGEVIRRLEAFRGISHKIATMTTRLLMTYYGVKLTRPDEVDVAVDRHVARVFLRTGLVQAAGTRKEYRASSLRDEILSVSRTLCSDFPAALDEPAYVIGRHWCTAEEAYCNDPKEPCPLRDVCPKTRRTWQVQ
ncbi:MAG: hypothetical protein J7M25_07065 [Deltaproteobacteria bacterium]|nr:hypothetical protein [Deltaproteobacteria bacterium]